MAIGDSIQRCPLLHLLLSYIVGIGIADWLYPYVGPLPMWGIGGLLLALVSLCLYYGISFRKGSGVGYGMVALWLFFVLGAGSYSLTRGQMCCAWPLGEELYEARVVESPRSRAHSVLCVLEVRAVADSASWDAVGRKVFAYMQPCAETDSLYPGDMIAFRGRVRVPKNFSDDLPFDYVRYVTMQGVSGTVYIPQGRWVEAERSGVPLVLGLLGMRQRLLEQYMYPTLDADASGVLAALTMGDRRALSEEVRASYADAGAAHVLALSGMHVGVIYLLLSFMLRILLPYYRLYGLRQLFVVGALWLFALMVGMPASVVRAVAMCTLYVVARWVSRDSAPLHVLSLTALLMLLVHPLYLFDVGFQLSFMAMVSILCVEPYVEALLRRRALHPVLGYLVSLVGVAIAAQLGTFPLVLYHFGTFPTYFLVTNLVAVPALSIVLLSGAVWWVLALVGFPWLDPFSHLLQYMVHGVNACFSRIAQWPGAVLHVAECSILTALFIYLMIFFTVLFVVKKWPRGLVFALVSLLGLLMTLLF